MIPALIAAAASAYSSYAQASQAAPVPAGPSNVTFTPGGIIVGSRVVGSGSAATSVPLTPAAPFDTSGASASPGSATAGAVPWTQSPWLWLGLAGTGLVLLLAMFLPPRSKREVHA